MLLEKHFDFLNLEKKIYSNWENSNCFKPKKNKNSFCIMMPPPNVTGSLHIGHALNFTIQDILIRFHRMKGKEVLWQAGTDHAGIATQMVVERQLLENNSNRIHLGRENFINKVWEWKNESGGKISNQLKRLGASADWSRERFTMDEKLSLAVKKVFVELYNSKIIYKDKRLINWDPKLLTAISDLEVEQKESDGFLWHIKYPIDQNKFIIIATTRPETMFGDTAVAVHPDDERYKEYIGQYCNLPLTDKKIKIIIDEYADPSKGTGAVKITPAHDFNDFEVGKRNNLDFVNIFDKFAKLNKNVPSQFIGLDRFEARKKILEELKRLNLLVKEEKQIMMIPYGDRSGVIIEPWLTEQWFCDAKKLSIDPIKSVKNLETEFIPKKWEKTFFNWMENIQPWCISRQLWWGHQIPAWYGPDKKIFVNFTYDDAKKEALNFYKKDVKLIQDEDVLDTWFSSALWTFSTLDWPQDSYELKRFYPGNVLVTGFDIIFFWVARMMMMGSYFMKKSPFSKVYIHPLIRDEKGQKMSKSKGNIIDPLDLMDKYGADTLRFTLASLLNPGRDVKLSETRVKGYKSFINKIWNAANFLKLNNCNFSQDINNEEIKLPINQWILNEYYDSSIKIQNYINNFSFNEAADKLYHFVWHTYCDWYIEFSKIKFNSDQNNSETKLVSSWVFIQILKISHPIIPFVTENLWQVLIQNKKYIMNEKIDDFNKCDNFTSSEKNINNLISIISSVRNFRSELNVPYKKKLDINFYNDNNEFLNFLKDNSKELENILKLDKITFEIQDKKIQDSAYILINNTTIIITLKDVIDTNSEIQKLRLKIEKETKTLDSIRSKLSNPSFLEKASSEIINNFQNHEKECKNSIEKINEIINTIN